ncbi:hypothetical protein OH818_08245 [Jiella pelagia]|uniref:Uncharacterized protein n=1 Tax=Jiella pelagia TaxID=2986949 RepID=A0ABY7C465_9HYPH|nr:hypothetical protein [Jiella pelagia]WAP70110.1 hypothetical protein OH818_08245 [Jiella pelagia]
MPDLEMDVGIVRTIRERSLVPLQRLVEVTGVLVHVAALDFQIRATRIDLQGIFVGPRRRKRLARIPQLIGTLHLWR